MPGKKATSLLISFSAMLLVLLFSTFAAAADWTVENGDSIQAAIDGASPGDTIQVEPGTYVEFIYVDKGLTIEGTGENVVLRAPVEGGILVEIRTSNVTLKGLTFEGVDWSSTGVWIWNLGDTNWNPQVRNCTFRNLHTGIWITGDAMNVVVANNTFENVRDYGIDSEPSDNMYSYFRCVSVGNRFIFDSGTDPTWRAYYAKSRLGNMAFFNTFEDYTGHMALNTPDLNDFLFNAKDNYWGVGAGQSDIDAVCSDKVLFVPWSFADAAGHADYQAVPLDGSSVFDLGESAGVTVSLALAESTAASPIAFPLAMAGYGHESPRATTVQDDNPGADTYTAYFILQNVETEPDITMLPIVQMTLEFPRKAIGDEADLSGLAIYAYDNGAWSDITGEDWFSLEVAGDVVRMVIFNYGDPYGDPVPIAFTAGNGDSSSSSSGCSSTGAASLGLLLLAPFALAFRRKP